MQQSSRQNNVSALRFVAALMVLSGHMSFLIGGTPEMLWGHQIQAMGVKIFFLMGGYLVTKSWLSDPRPLRYALKRFSRIWPPLAVYVLFAAFVAGPCLSTLPVGAYFRQPSTYAYLRNLRLFIVYTLPGVFETNPYPAAVNGSLWTLPVEAAMYLAIPLMLCVLAPGGKKRRWTTPAAWGICLLVCAASVAQQQWFPGARLILYGTNWVDALAILPYYFIGWACALTDGFRKVLNLQAAIALLCAFQCFGLQGAVYNAVFMALFSYFVYSFAFAAPPVFANAFSNYEISYGLYLYGFFIQQIVVAEFLRQGRALSLPLVLAVSLFVTSLAALLSCVLVEQPVQRLSKRLLAECPGFRLKEKAG